MGRVTGYKLSLVTFPSLGIAMFAFCWAVIARLEHSGGPGGTLMTVLGKLGMVLGVGLFFFVLIACVRGPHKGLARFGMVYNLALLLVPIGFFEWITPHPPTTAQRLLLEQIRRRHEELKVPYRGTLMIPGMANDLGWLDRPHSFTKSMPRILFIGDSMLEVRSRRRLALRVEDRFASNNPLEVINLSIASSDPLDYRFRLNEYAFDYQPEQIFVFLYGPNDFWIDQPYQPYRSPPIRVNSQTVQAAQEVGFAAEVVDRLRQLSRQREVFPDRKSFLSAVDERLPLEKQHLLYTLAAAHSDAVPREILRSTRDHIEGVGRQLIQLGTRALERVGMLGPVTSDWWNLEDFQVRYAAVFTLPREKRLRSLAELFAQFMQISPESVWQLLHSQTPEFQSWLTAEQDKMWYLAIPLNRLAGLIPPRAPETEGQRKVNAAKVEMYVRLLCEMNETARAHGCKLTYVFIPSPALADQDWIHFWGDLLPLEDSTPVYKEVLRQMPERASCLDLGLYQDRLRGAYWPLDGHWTDGGNDVVADILADFLRGQKK